MNFSRDKLFCKNIIIINGHSNTGKSLIAPVLSSLNKMEMWSFNHIYEYICVIHHFKKINNDAAKTLLRLYSDIDLYNMIIGRNVNWRSKDLSSIQYNLKKYEYEKKYKYDADDLISKANNSELILPIVTHYIFGFSKILFESFEDKLLMYINVDRNPAWVIKNWYEKNLVERNLVDPTDFELCLKDKNNFLPYFLIESNLNINDLSNIERAILVYKQFREYENMLYSKLPNSLKNKIYTIYFEKFILEPNIYLDEICKITKTAQSSLTKKIIAKMGLPRNLCEGFYRNQNFITHLDKENVDTSFKKYVLDLINEYDTKIN